MTPANVADGFFRLVTGKGVAPDIRAASITLGTHSSADFLLNDPLAAPQHARLRRTAEGYAIEDLGSATGTFVDGLPVEGRTALHEGARIVLGVTRIAVALPVEAGRRILLATVEEGRFHFQARDAEGFRSDPDEWTRSELHFGRVPFLAASTWLALAIGLGFLTLVLATHAGERALSPGRLDGSHAELDAGCSACHTGFGAGSVGIEGCAGCHGELLGSHHPFSAAPMEGDRVRLEEGACLMCHAGHGERDVEQALAFAGAQPASLACTPCHAESPTIAPPLPAPTPGQRAYGFDPFSHAAHLRALPAPACGACHTPSQAREDFAPVSQGICQGCHAGSAEDPEVRRKLELAGLVWQTDWHGSEDIGSGRGCLACHDRLHAGTLASDPVARPSELVVHWLPRSHKGDVGVHNCGECHKRLDFPTGDDPTQSAFRHSSHVASLASEPERCLRCHDGVAGSDRLGEDPLLPPIEACGDCHYAPSGKVMVLRLEHAGPSLEHSLPAFSHALHAGVEGSCFACHGFEQETGAALTNSEARSCVPCHADHQGIARGACAGCHPAGDPATQALFAGRRLERLTQGLEFPHFKAGHAHLIASQGCDECHPPDNLARANRVEELALDSNVAQVCGECHHAEFHWERK